MNTPEIEELKRLVEEHYGKRLTTTTDFEEFSVILRLRHDISVSPSTLKRLYGYVSDSHKPRMLTLDSLFLVPALAEEEHALQLVLLRCRSACEQRPRAGRHCGDRMGTQPSAPPRISRREHLPCAGGTEQQGGGRRPIHHGLLHKGTAAVPSFHRAQRRTHASVRGRTKRWTLNSKKDK